MPGLKLVAELGGDGSGFDAMMRRAGVAKDKLAASFSGLKGIIAGAFTVGAITTMVRNTANFADRIDETSSRLGVATDRLQEWEYAAKQAGASAEQLLNFVERLTLAAADPAKLKFFEQMGFNPSGMTVEQLVSKTAAFARGNSSTDVTRVLSEIVGSRISGSMVNTLKSLEELGEQARKVGAVLDQQTLQALAKLNDQFAVLSQILYARFGPAILEAGKLAMTAFHLVVGRAKQGGHLLGKMQPMEAVSYLTTGLAGITALFARLKQLNKAFPEGGQAFEQEMEKLAQSFAAMDDAKPFVPGQVTVEPSAESQVQRRRAGSLLTDPLIGVGNFLGRNPALVNNIAEEQLQVARSQLEIQKQMLAQMRAARSPSAMTLEVPAL